MGGGRLGRQEGGEEQREQAPIAIVPTRRPVEESQAVALRSRQQSVEAEISSLVSYSRGIRVPATGRTLADIETECTRFTQTLERLQLSDVPILGNRYRDEIQLVRDSVERARSEAQAGNLGSAITLLGQAREQLSAVGEVFSAQVAWRIGGVPQTIRIEGIEPAEAFDLAMGAMELLIRDVGTEREGRYRAGYRAIRLYSDQANQLAYNADNPLIQRERDSLLGFIIRKGEAARRGDAYTRAEAAEDERMLRSFEANIRSIRTQVISSNTTALTQWRDVLAGLSAQEADAQARARLDVLRADLETALTKLRAGQMLSAEDLRALSNRYYLLTGRSPPLSEDERSDMLRDAARDLRGTARTARDGTAEWFGEQAVAALREGNRELAALAVAMGILERAARGSNQGAREYISSYWQIHDTIAERRPATPGMMSAYTGQIELATVLANSDRLARDFARGGTREKRERVTNAAAQARERLRGGDAEGAKRILNMARAYGDLLAANQYGTWTGSSEMEAAIDLELQGQNAETRFGNAVIHNQFSAECARFVPAIADWGRGISAQKAAVDAALEKVNELARQGNAREAQRVLTLIVMYTDAVERLGVRRGGQIVSLSEGDLRTVRGMERSLGALVRGEQMVDAREIETAFMESFNSAQQGFVEREAVRLEGLMRTRPIGNDVVTEALRTARSRARASDYRGAITLLEFVRYYYGEPAAAVAATGGRPASSARSEGWRYVLFAGRGSERVSGYARGKQDLLDAIRMEINADSQQAHLAAAQLMDRGSQRIAQVEALQNDRMPIYRRYMGLDNFVEGQADTRGRIPLGERSGNRYPDYLDLAAVRAFEAANPADSVTSRGPTLAQLLDQLTDAANRGDTASYQRAREAFNARFAIVASRATRARGIDSATAQLRDLDASIRELRTLYGATPPAAVTTRLDTLERARADLSRRFTEARRTSGELPTGEYSRLLVSYDRERRLAVSYSFLSSQIELNDQYRRMVSLQSAGQLMTFAKTFLEAARPHLVTAREAIVAGDMALAETEFRAGMYERRCALGVYNADNALTLTRSDSWTRGLSEMWTFITDNDAYWSSSAPRGGSYPAYEGYQNMMTDGFHDILFGTGSREERSRIDRLFNSGRVVELSVLTIPADNMSQVLSDFVPDQRRIAQQARDAVAASRAGNQAEADRLLAQAESTWRAMSARAEDNQWWGNAIAVVAALGISLVPGGGWIVGGSIFTTMAFDRVASEYNAYGEASTEAWAMLALTVVTMGLGGAAALTRSAALTAEAAGATNAARLLTASRALTYTTLGIGVGFSAYAGYEAVQAFRAGRTRDGVLMTGMALFPFAHMTGARGWRALRSRAGRGALEVETALEELEPSVQRPAVEIEVTETTQARRAQELRSPNRLWEFLRDFAGRDSAGRAALLETLPESVRPSIARLADLPVIRTALESGALNEVAMSALRRTIATFEGPRPGPGGPQGTRPQWESSGWLSGFRGIENFRSFLADLLVPEGAPAARLNARDVAQGRLAQLRAANPDAGRIVDGLLRNPSVADSIQSGTDSPLSNRMIDLALNGRAAERGRPAVQGIRQMIPQEIAAAEQEAVAVYEQEVQMAVGYRGPFEVGTRPSGEPAAGAGRMQPPRAMAGEGPGAGGGRGIGGGAPVPGTAGPAEGGTTAGGGRAPGAGGGRGGGGRQAAPRGPQEAAPAAPSEDAAAAAAAERGASRVIVERHGILERMGGAIAGRYRAFRANRAARRAAPATPEEFVANARRALDDTLASAARPDEIPRVIESAVQGLDAAAQAEIAGAVRTAPQRIAEMMKSLWRRANERGMPKPQRRQAWRTMTRLYAPDNVRAALEVMARTDPELATILRQTDAVIVTAARTARLPLGNFRSRLAVAGMGDDALFMVETLERAAQRPLLDARARARELETATIPRLEDQLASARRTAEVAHGRARTRADARVAALENQLGRAQGELSQVQGLLQDPSRAPLAATERLLGMRLVPSERGPVIARLQDAGIITPDTVLQEVISAGRRAEVALSAIDTAGDPVATAFKAGVERSLTRSTDNLSTSLDDVLLTTLRSDEMARAVGRRFNPRVEEMYRGAVRDGTLNEVLGRMDTLPSEVGDGIGGFARNARATMAEDFALMMSLGERATSAVGTGTGVIGNSGAEFQTMGQRFGNWWAQSWARGTVRWLFRSPVGEPGTAGYGEYSRFTQYYLRAGREILRTTPEGMTMARLGGWARIGVQVAIWGTESYFLGRKAYGIYRTITGAATVQEGIERCRREFGFNCSEDSARFIMSRGGADFFAYLPNIFPRGTERRPENAADLQRAMERQEIMIDPNRLDEAIRDGDRMYGQLSGINSLLDLRTRGSAEERQSAERDLAAILTPWGITVANADALLAREGKRALDITDMVDLRRDDWVRRGVAVRFRDVVVETFLLDTGIGFRRGEGTARFLVDNPDVFARLWNMVQAGNVPLAYVDDALASLMREGVLAGIRGQIPSGRTLEALIMENLTAANVYFETGIPRNSFIGRLDDRAAQDPALRTVLETILSQYRGNAAAMGAFRGFAMLDTEEIYGNPAELATLIVENPQNAIEVARQRGFVGVGLLLAIDPTIRNLPPARQTEIVRFVRDHSDAGHGVLRWIDAHRINIGGNLGNILNDLASTDAAASMTAAQLYTPDQMGYLDRQAERFKGRGWWRGQTPSEIRAERERAAQRGPPAPGQGAPAAQQRAQTREEQIRDEARPRAARRPGFETATPTRREDQPIVVALTPQMRQQAGAFFSSERGAQLGLALDGLLAGMYRDTRGDGVYLRELYGESARDADNNPVAPEAARTAIREEIFRILMSTSPPEVTMRGTWGITITGSGDSMRVTIDMGRARDPLRNRIRQYVMEQRRGRQPPAGEGASR
ncbi:hypothetical protein L0Y65_06080 [Candidatus Micrarchaeota archaeon]|nr:hypothetical protein [Candidatus Micrarchaeota archaeon]